MRIPLYLRIWLAVLAAVAVITLAFASLWRMSADAPPPREVVIRSESGEILGQTRARPVYVPGQGAEFTVPLLDGSTLVVQMPPRRAPGEAMPPPRPWIRGANGLWWMLGIVALAVAIGSYPIIRRLTQRLEALRRGVERLGEGDLRARVDESGSDEVAFLARRFNRAAQQIEHLVASQKSLLANASHELRSPLTRIRMGLELMGSSHDEAAKAEIERNISELDQLVDEILLASRLDSRNAEVGTVETVDLGGLAAEECAATDASLTIAPGTSPVLVKGISRLLRRLIRNLLENARRYSDGPIVVELSREFISTRSPASGEGGTVEGGRTSAAADRIAHAVLRVRDRGPGVAPEQRERIFEPFYRLPGASERAGGVGLGLSLVRSIAQRHGGSVRCEDNPGGGASFVVSLPIERADT